MSQRILYVRHAESTNNDLYARTGSRDGRHPDPLLTPLGERQVRLAGEALAAEGLADVPVWASPAARAVQTAAAVVRAGTGRGIALVPDLVEGGGTYRYDGGVRVATPGRPLDELRSLAGVPIDWAEPTHAGWDGGFEEHDAIPARAARLVDAVRASGHPTVVLVAHEWLAQHVIRAALGLPPGNDAARRGWFAVPNASITQIALDDDGSAELVCLGVTTHLGDEIARPPAARMV